jgi:hypothetical protein
MTATTQTREPEMGLTFEKVWAMFQESDRRMQQSSKETDQKLQEVAHHIKETGRQIKETFEKLSERSRKTDRQIDKTTAQIEKLSESSRETDRQIKATNVQIGKLSNRFGELAEHLVAPNIVQKFNSLGFHFSDISAGLREIILDESKQIAAEFDILLENGESSIAVEVKSKPSNRDVEDHVRRLEILRRYKDKIGDNRKIYGALAGAILPLSVKAVALKTGFYVITQSGDTVKIDVPEGFIPTAW